MRHSLETLRLWLCALLLLPTLASAATLRLGADTPQLSLEGHLLHFADASNALPFEQVAQPGFVQERFMRLPGFRSLGYDTQAHWFQVTLNPTADAPTRWVLALGTPELDTLDVWVQRPEGGYRHYPMGYTRPYADRPLRTRLFALPIETFPGMQVFMRVNTTNAISLQAELWHVDAYTANETLSNFLRGGYFGILLIAVLFYLILGARLRDAVMLCYAVYIAGRLMFLLGTNGYVPVLAGMGSGGEITDAVQRIGWVLGSVCILLMWDRLLELKQHHPWLHRLFLLSAGFNLGFLPFALWPALVNDWVLYAVKLANVLDVLGFIISMALLLRQWWRSRRSELMLYFIAFVIPAAGTVLNFGVDFGQLPWNAVTANFLQLATLVHVLVMSYGLALRLRQVQRDKVQAQQAAAISTQRAEEQRRFVAMLSHEFRNPLAAIDRSAQMLGFKRPELLSGEERRLEQIRHNVATLSGLVDNFLVSETLDHGMRPNVQACTIAPLLEQVLHMLGEEAGKRTRLKIDPPGASFALDPNLIGMAIGNLIDNALRYSPPGSQVEVSASLGKQLSIRVADRGPALSSEEMAQLGEPYYRASSSLGKKGSGLGFYFTRNMVEAHGGRLLARVRPGGGMEVEIALPRSGDATYHAAPCATTPSPTA